jgi:type VI secretion system protein ImpE
MASTPLSNAESSLHAGDPEQALKLLQDQVRARPGDPRLRVFLFQLLCVLGQWERALNQLDTAANLDPAALAMKQTYGEAIRCELLRAEVFAGRKVPLVFGQPDAWLALLIESLLRAARGETAAAQALRDQAFEQAPETPGLLDGQPFGWIADGDMRLGPVLEAIVNGRYYWIPFARLKRITLEAPADLRDAVWMPAYLQFENGGESPALVPARYPGSEAAADGLLRLGRKTVWDEVAPEVYCGLGQRVIATDAGEFPLMDVRSIVIGSSEVDAAAPAS